MALPIDYQKMVDKPSASATVTLNAQEYYILMCLLLDLHMYPERYFSNYDGENPSVLENIQDTTEALVAKVTVSVLS